MWSSAYHRLHDSVSRFGDYATLELALEEARTNVKRWDVDEAWVRDSAGAMVWHSRRGWAAMPEKLRGRVVHGWAFRDLPAKDVESIRAFLASGERDDLPETYRQLFEIVMGQK